MEEPKEKLKTEIKSNDGQQAIMSAHKRMRYQFWEMDEPLSLLDEVAEHFSSVVYKSSCKPQQDWICAKENRLELTQVVAMCDALLRHLSQNRTPYTLFFFLDDLGLKISDPDGFLQKRTKFISVRDDQKTLCNRLLILLRDFCSNLYKGRIELSASERASGVLVVLWSLILM